MVKKSEIRALIDRVKTDPEIHEKKKFLGLINYFIGGVTQEDLDEVKNW